ncbi:MAG: hypothetical protein FWD69_05455 [Polyangiaceae bacterium]|nr:hypothetical protein [Polyangiaceae bacterium]
MRKPSLAWLFTLAAFVVFTLCMMVPGCGRSSLDTESLNDGIAPAACGPETCPTGCCDADGTCRLGSDTRACGSTGAQCNDCIAQGFEFCDSRKVCGRNVETCGPETCASGCCAANAASGAQCLAGDAVDACGSGGATCINCGSDGSSCDAAARTCTITKCDPTNCNGCCVGDQCMGGTDVRSCGAGGAQCVTCAAGQSCAPVSTGGGECEVEPACGPVSCAGCCDGDTCAPGDANDACGSGGAACADCSLSPGSVCDVNAAPRTCQNLCPRSYDACPDNTSTPVTPNAQGVCAAVDLDAIQSACTGGPNTATCVAAFQALAAANDACETCVSQFNVAFADASGLYLCVAPFVSSACNHTSGCATDCVSTSCAACPDANRSTCRSQVEGAGGPCATFVTQTACTAAALFPGKLCSPLTYGLNFGRWLRAVGAHFCGD